MMESEFQHDENQNGLGYGSGEVIRIDSLEENPFMIDPREVSSMTSVPRVIHYSVWPAATHEIFIFVFCNCR